MPSLLRYRNRSEAPSWLPASALSCSAMWCAASPMLPCSTNGNQGLGCERKNNIELLRGVVRRVTDAALQQRTDRDQGVAIRALSCSVVWCAASPTLPRITQCI